MMEILFRARLLCIIVSASLYLMAFCDYARADENTKGIAFFERRIRPVLVEHCYECHAAGAKRIEGGLQLDTRENARKGGESGPAVVPGNVKESLILKALRYEKFEMPPKGRLSADVIQDFEHWIRIGAPDARDALPKKTDEEPSFDLQNRKAEHWCWQPPKRPEIPAGHPRPIDFFIEQNLEKHGIDPAEAANRRTILRRLKFDLIGLPPTIDEIESFLNDDSRDAYESFVDRWLYSPHFGEKWAGHWLDVIRFSETKGHVTDQERPYSWKYRDYVIDALNDDLPFNQFIIEHLAGDLLSEEEHRPGNKGETNIAPTATGALFMHEMHFMAVDPIKQRWDEIDAQIDTIGKAFLGLTLGCSRCHDHKFDAISQQDYYALAGFFYSTEQSKSRTAPRLNLSAATAKKVEKLEAEYEAFLENKKIARRRAQSPKTNGYFPISEELGIQSPNDYLQLVAKMKPLEAADPSWSFWVRSAKDVAGSDVPLLIRGNHKNPAELVPRRFLSALSKEMKTSKDNFGTGSGRLWLANQIADPDNPLTARVWVNRLWHYLFGRGIVASPNNFGKLGQSPTHPELLDYLALRLIDSNWSTKTVIREIVLSNAYRRSSAVSKRSMEIDPNNRFFSHQNRRRLPAELIRDNILAVSGALNKSMFGPSVAPLIPKYATANKKSNIPASGPVDGKGRRSIYLRVRRNFFDPLLLIFDFPDRGKSHGKRPSTTVPSQALALLNSPFVHQQARHWGRQISNLDGPSAERISIMFQQATARLPDAKEQAMLKAYMNDLKTVSLAEEERWINLAHMVINLNEFIVIE